MITNWIRQSMAGETPDIDPSAPLEDRQMWRQYYEGFVAHYSPQWIKRDLTVHSSEYGYTETADWLACIRGQTVLGLLKTGAHDYPQDAMRLAAVAHEMPDVNRYAILFIRPRFSRLVPCEHLDEWFSAFLGMKALREALGEETISRLDHKGILSLARRRVS